MIYVLPGMGADHRMYSGPWKTLRDCTFLNWPAHQGEKTIAAVATRIIEQNKIVVDSTLVGSSLGGMVACEIAKKIGVKSLVLLGSAKAREEVNAFLSLVHPLVDLTPVEFLQRLSGEVPADIARMFSAGDPLFIRYMCDAIFAWEGLGETGVNLVRIHGRRDWIIPLPEGVQYVLEGGHFLAITHAQECVEIIKSYQCDQ